MTPEQVEYFLQIVEETNVLTFSILLVLVGLVIGKLVKLIIKKIRKN
jgi:hypothetical protein